MPLTPQQKRTDLVEVLSNAITAILGLAAFVYVTGAAVLWARLVAKDLPANPVVTGLPRELLVATGLRTVVVPSLLLALVALAGLWFRSRLDRARADKTVGFGLRVPSWILFGILYAVGAGFAISMFVSWGTWAFGWTIAIYVAFVAAGLVSRLEMFRNRPMLRIAALALLVGGIGALVRIVVELEKPDLQSAVVCVKDGGDPYSGLLVGETSNVVYIGQEDEHRVLSVPTDRVGELWIGTTDIQACSLPEPTSAAARPDEAG